MPTAFFIGAAAGLGVAVPIGAIAVLIVRTGALRGFRMAAAAGAGAATVDLIYALAAVFVGAAIVAALAAVLVPLRLAAAALLIALAARVLLQAHPRSPAVDEPAARRSAARIYLLFVGLTLLNPATVAYFLTLAIGLPEVAEDAGARVAFALGAGIASLVWQTLLAAAGAALHTRLGPRLQLATTLLSGAILVAFALKIALDALG